MQVSIVSPQRKNLPDCSFKHAKLFHFLLLLALLFFSNSEATVPTLLLLLALLE